MPTKDNGCRQESGPRGATQQYHDDGLHTGRMNQPVRAHAYSKQQTMRPMWSTTASDNCCDLTCPAK